MYIKNVEIIDFYKDKFILNKETTGRRFGNDLIYFHCENCKNQVIGDESGTVYDCNNCKLIEDIKLTISGKEKIYCINYVKGD